MRFNQSSLCAVVLGLLSVLGVGCEKQYTLTYSVLENGSISGEAAQIVALGGSGTSVTAVANDDYLFSEWSDGNTDNPRTDTSIMRNVTVRADFSRAFVLSFTASENGTILGDSRQFVAGGESGSTVTAVPDEGFAFFDWSDGRTDNPRTDISMTADLSVVANFVSEIRLTYGAGANGSIAGDISQRIAQGRSGEPVTAVGGVFDRGTSSAQDRYEFVEWSDGRTDNPRTDTEVMADVSVEASFARQFILSYTAGANGSLTGEVSQFVFQDGSGSVVTAEADAGAVFVDWSDGRTDNPRTDIDVVADVTVTANFARQFTLTYTAGENGTIVGDSPQVVNETASGTAVTAAPDEGFIFLEWNDGSMENPRTDLEVAGDVTVSAQFIQEIAMIDVPAGSFTMGRSDVGDDDTRGSDDELPRHEVTLSDYQIGRFEVTNAQYCDFLNYAIDPSRNLLRRENGDVWAGQNARIYGGDSLRPVLAYNLAECNIEFVDGAFRPKSKFGMPGVTVYSMGNHPATNVFWFGGALYANWLSQVAGYTPVYDTTTWEADFTNDGYHLPTEAQWERAAAWDGMKHWAYSITADTLTGSERANFYDGPFCTVTDEECPYFNNPLGLMQDGVSPYTAPVGWFDGINVSPNGEVMTVDSVSPVGAYDMSGNVLEFCHDWYSATYYASSSEMDPTGPTTGTERVARGGTWGRVRDNYNSRSARRHLYEPEFTDGILGFRLAR